MGAFLNPATRFTRSQQAGFFYARKRRLQNGMLGALTQWVPGLTVAQGEYVQNAGYAYQAAGAGTTGSTTPPTHSGGTVSDGNVGWLFVDVRTLSWLLFEQVTTPNPIDTTSYADREDGGFELREDGGREILE